MVGGNFFGKFTVLSFGSSYCRYRKVLNRTIREMKIKDGKKRTFLLHFVYNSIEIKVRHGATKYGDRNESDRVDRSYWRVS